MIRASAHLPSASNHDLWYEMSTNMPVVPDSEPSPYSDTPSPKRFGTVSPLDPQLFSTIAEYVQALMAREPNAKYSPIEVAEWVEECVTGSKAALNEARRSVRSRNTGAFRRLEEDVFIQVGLGTFFACKLRSAVMFEIFDASANQEAGRQAVAHYQRARDAWAEMAERARAVYLADVSYGSVPKRSGHWSDRLPGIDADLMAMKTRVVANLADRLPHGTTSDEIWPLSGHEHKALVDCAHKAPSSFTPGEALVLSLAVFGGTQRPATRTVRLCYRHVTQAERWRAVDANAADGVYRAVIPAEYTEGDYSLEYYFELDDNAGNAWIYPGFNKRLSNQPYFVLETRNH